MEQPSTGKVIIKTSLITTVALILACVLIGVIVSFCIPYKGYKFANSLGMDKTALFFAERYADNGNIDGLIYCIELDEELLNSKNDAKYANKLIAHTEKFFEFDNVDEYFAKLDNYYIANSPAHSKVGLYSYLEHVVSRNYMARAMVGQEDKMIFRGKPTELNKLFVEDISLMETAIIYSALYRAISQNGNVFKPFLDNNSFTEFYYKVTESVPAYIHGIEQEEGDTLKTLFLLRNVIYLVNKVSEFFEANSIEVPMEWQGFLSFKYKDKDINLAYSDMFLDYIGYKKGEE